MTSKSSSTEKAEPVKRLTPAEWAEAEALWETGEFTLKDLSDQFGIRPETLSRRFKKNGIVKGSSAAKEAVKAAVTEAAMGDATARAEEIRELKERHDRYNKVLFQMVSRKIAACQQHGLSERSMDPDISTLIKCAKLGEMIRSERYILLNVASVDQGDEIPEIVVRELTQGEVNRVRRMQAAENEEFDGLEVMSELAGEEAQPPDGT